MSVFLLCEKGINLDIIKELDAKNITLEDILKEPDVLKKHLGKIKGYQVLNAVSKIENIYEESIFELVNYGITIEQIKKLVSKGITIEKLKKYTEEDFKNLDLSDYIYEKIHNATIRYIGDYFLKMYNKYKEILGKILEPYDEDYIEASSLQNEKQKQLCKEFIEYISKNEKYCLIKNNELYIKKESIKVCIDDYVSQMIYKSDFSSIFAICDYGITIPIVNRLYEADLTIANIKEYPIILNEYLGESKSDEVFDAINKIEDSNIESLYLLYEFGVSKNIIDQMKNEKITMLEIKSNNIDTLGTKYNLGTYAVRVIYEALKKYIVQSALKKDKKYPELEVEKNSPNIVMNVIEAPYKENITYSELKNNEIINNFKISDEDIKNSLLILQEKDKIKCKNDLISLKLENLDEAIEKYIKKDIYKKVVKEIFEGKTQVDVGIELDLTRERIRQIFNRAIKDLPSKLDEDVCYKEVFCKYDWDVDTFCKTFNVKRNVYYYLSNKYEKGQGGLEEILGIDYLDEEQEEIIKKHLKLVSYNGMLIKEEKYSLLKAILKEERIQYVITDLIEKYNNVIKEYEFSNLEYIDTVRNVENVLARKDNIIMSSKRRFRYYNYELLTSEDIEELINLLDVDDGVYYADYFFRENLELMNKLNILDENELYNMLKKYSKKDNIKFSTMPIILIGYETREEFFLEKMNNLSPINWDEFVNFLNKEYGYKFDSTKAYMNKEFSKYITKGIINTEEKVFNDDEIKLLKQALIEKIYPIKDLKNILNELFQKDCSEYIRSINFEKIGFRIREQYILRTDAGSIDQVIEEIALENEIFDLSTSKLKRLGQSFQWRWYQLLFENKLIKYENNLYYTKKWLDKNGITNAFINEFKEKIYNFFADNEAFTIFNVKQKELIKGYEILEINDVFIESIIRSIKGIKCISIENNIVFIKSDAEFFNKADFIEKIILDNNISRVKDIKELLLERYNINIELSQIKELIDLKKYEMKDTYKEEKKLEEESIENSSDNYNIVMCLKYLEKVFGLGVQKNFSSDRNSEFLKRFDNALNTLTQKEKTIAILKNGLKDGKARTAEEVAEEIGIVSENAIGTIEKRTIEKLKDKERTKILRKYFNFEATNTDDTTADFILNLL